MLIAIAEKTEHFFIKREHFFPTVIMTIVLKQSRRCANFFLTDTIDFLKALWGIGDVIVMNQKC